MSDQDVSSSEPEGEGDGEDRGTAQGRGDAPPVNALDDFPRSRFRVNPQQIIPIFGLLITLFAVLAMRKGCANGVAAMFQTISPAVVDAAPALTPVRWPDR